MKADRDMVLVWDPLVRAGHWLLVAAFAVAYLTQGEPPQAHVWAGYTIGGIVLLRVVWGFVGPRRAQFADFLSGPGAAFRDLQALLRFRADRHLGHSPASGAMAVALLLSLAVTVGTGLLAYGETEGAGPLAFLFPAAQAPNPAADAAEPLFPSLDDAPAAASATPGPAPRRADSAIVGVHEAFANITLALAALHAAGVVLASLAHRENLVLTMVTGRKRAP